MSNFPTTKETLIEDLCCHSPPTHSTPGPRSARRRQSVCRTQSNSPIDIDFSSPSDGRTDCRSPSFCLFSPFFVPSQSVHLSSLPSLSPMARHSKVILIPYVKGYSLISVAPFLILALLPFAPLNWDWIPGPHSPLSSPFLRLCSEIRFGDPPLNEIPRGRLTDCWC